jgi:predicted AAA+ superfamily ATPase
MLTLDEVLFTGLYPPIHDRKLKPSLWYDNYVRTYVERDVRQMVNVRDLSTFRRFVRLCAGRIGQLLNLSQLANDCGITHNTVKAWISILEASYIIFLLYPHYQGFNKRLIKSPKLYFYDSGLACWLLSIRNTEQLGNHSLRGSLFEGFIIGERIKASFNEGIRSDLFFWRDRSGNEIDLIIDLGEKLQPVEIKSGQTLNRDYFRGLKRWLSYAGELAARPILVYGGRETGFESGIDVFPWMDEDWLDLPSS